MAERPRPAVLVIGVGNDLRHDDGAGVEIARRLCEQPRPAGIDVREEQGEATALIDAWQFRDAVVLVDTMRSGAAPGTIRRLDASQEPLPMRLGGSSSTHAVTLGEAIELARALGRLPSRVVVFAVEGRRFEAGVGLSDEVSASVPALIDAVLREACALAAGRPTTSHERSLTEGSASAARQQCNPEEKARARRR